MSIPDSKREIIWYLEMTRIGELKPKSLPKDTQIVKFGVPLPAMNRFFYLEVGRKWQWTERKSWTEDQWNEWVLRKELETWMMLYRDTPAGYFELSTLDSDVELAYFGLLPQFIGKGLGGGFLTKAIKNAWRPKTRRVWVHTCSLDHPNALKNYQARGFKIYHETLSQPG